MTKQVSIVFAKNMIHFHGFLKQYTDDHLRTRKSAQTKGTFQSVVSTKRARYQKSENNASVYDLHACCSISARILTTFRKAPRSADLAKKHAERAAVSRNS